MLTGENRRQDGAEHETLALRHLEAKGYQLVRQNFTFGRIGEIDLIMRDGATWVFIEVKARRSYRYGRPEEAITEAKRRVIRRVAEGFIHLWKIADVRARFDVVAVDYVSGRDGEPEIRHLIDAFP
ncbi:MAG TPA: YraN family protein [Candidatus Kapabacteria bacterium]|jgi:putative endonuclease|nr:YraN family protein [Candidatus Kapabacteria bacterium]